MEIIETGKKVLRTEASALESAIEKLDSSFEKAVQLIQQTSGRVVVTGMGKSGIIGKKIAATLTSTGTPAVFLHPSEALHGDIGIINPDDIVLVLSTSGETQEILRLLNLIRRIGVKVIALVGSQDSTLAKESDVSLDCCIQKEACPIGLVPTTSTTLTLAMGDAIAISLMKVKGFGEEDFRVNHPGGIIGKKLMKVKHLMHTGDELPVVTANMHMGDVIQVIDRKRFGVGIVVDSGNCVEGIITDGDLRRLFLKGVDFNQITARECMIKDPLYIVESSLAVEALKIMEDHLITSLVVRDEDGRLKGLIHLHDLWKTEMI